MFEASKRLMHVLCRYFLIVDNVSLWIYTYTGRLHLNPKYSGIQVQLIHLNPKCVSLGLNYIGIRNFSDKTSEYMATVTVDL